MAIPVYMFAGFLESGKTSFIASVLQDPGFTRDESTLIIQCEEGETEYEPDMLKKTHSVVECIEDEDEYNGDTLRAFVRKHHPDRVIVEMNGMWDLDAAIERTPKVLEIYQIITTVNAETFDLYAKNMGQRMLQHITDADDGTSEDYGAGMPPPYDMDAPIVEIEDHQFGIFYLDASENPEEYDGKTVRFKGYIYRGRNIGKDEFVPGRMGMVCCAEDVRFVGFIAKANGLPLPEPKTWQMITAEVKAEERTQYKGVGPVLYVTKLEPCEPPEEEVVF